MVLWRRDHHRHSKGMSMKLFCSEANKQDSDECVTDIKELYDFYYTTREYHKRYPKANQATLEFLLENGGRQASSILDFGCGNGRYALPLLQLTKARITGYDISQSAINEFAGYLQGNPLSSRVRLIYGDASLLEQQGGYDVIMLLFGVLSHVGDRADRIRVLKQMRALIADQGHLLLTVPSMFRRRPLEMLNALLKRARGCAGKAMKEPGNIVFTRNIADRDIHFFYHLYTAKGLKQELGEAGFTLRLLLPESLLPEWMITQSDLLGKIDAALLPLLPASFGYGICVAADPA